jgi:hypothetical protein
MAYTWEGLQADYDPYSVSKTGGEGNVQGNVGIDAQESITPFSMPTTPTYTAPPDYVAPEWDEERITSLAQKRSAAGLRGMRSQMQKITGGYYENPNVKRMTLRDALAGYGQGIENVMSGAEKDATSEYAREYGVKGEEAKINYGAKTTKSQMDFQAQLASYQNSFKALYGDYMASNYGSDRSSGGRKVSGGGVTGVKWAPSSYGEKTNLPSDLLSDGGGGTSWDYYHMDTGEEAEWGE